MEPSLLLVTCGAVVMLSGVLPALAAREVEEYHHWHHALAALGEERHTHHALVYTNYSNKEVANTWLSSEVEPTTIFALLDLGFNMIFAIKYTHDTIVKTEERASAIEAIANGHKRNIQELVRNAHRGAKHAQASGGGGVAAFFRSDDFLLFQELVAIFDTAHQMCVKEESFFEAPGEVTYKWATKQIMGESAQKLKQNVDLFQSQNAIIEIQEALHRVVDLDLCPMLEMEMNSHLSAVYDNIQRWEEHAQSLMGGKPISWFEMFNKIQTSGYGKSSAVAAGMMGAVNEATLNLGLWGKKTHFFTKNECLKTLSGQPSAFQDKKLGQYEVVFDEDYITEDEMRKKTGLLRELAEKINAEFDIASMNLNMFEKECKRYAPNGRKDVIARMDERSKMYRVMTCDYCMRYNCRAIGVLSVLGTTYDLLRSGVGIVLKPVLKKCLPKWLDQIMRTVRRAGDLALGLAVNTVVRLYSALVFFVSSAHSLDQKENCHKLAENLRNDQRALRNYQGYDTKTHARLGS